MIDLSTCIVACASVIASHIYQLESGSGAQDWCRRYGLYNGYGYGRYCYLTHEDAQWTVEDWIRRHSSLGLPQMLCLYQSGKPQADCEYYRKFLKLEAHQ